MRYLGNEAWEAFTKGNESGASFDGGAFEALIRALLNASFPGNWKATPLTRDGGKDVVDRSIPGDIAWAECKMYRRPISLQVGAASMGRHDLSGQFHKCCHYFPPLI